MNFYYHGAWRMDWGLDNPNKTATLIACLMIAVWSLALIWKRGFWPALVLFTALAWCLVQTYSRGGMVALVVSLAVLVAWIPRPWPRSRWIAVVASLWILGAFVLLARAENRYSQGLFTEDQSIGNRLIIWRQVPEMMAAAPWGWGWGKAGDSYTQWFQPVNQSLNYLNLVSSHFTWMVEFGWLGSVLYLFAWLTVFQLCWPQSHSRLAALPLAIWVAFGVGACFSHVAESPWLWIVPILALGYALRLRFKTNQWPRLANLRLSGAVSVVCVVVLVLMGHFASFPIAYADGLVTIGRGSTQTLIFVDRKVLGLRYGHTFRKYWTQNRQELATGTYILTESPSPSAPSNISRFVISGGSAKPSNLSDYLKTGTLVILVNPSFLPEDIKINDSEIGKAIVYFGEYSNVPTRSSWVSYPGIKASQISGASDFVPDWPQDIFKADKS